MDRHPTDKSASEADYLAAYFSSPEDEPDTPAALEECKRRAAIYWSREACRERRVALAARTVPRR
jgi:hypothetical protein